MVNAQMARGVLNDDLMVRVGKDARDAACLSGAQEMNVTGRPTRGMVMVAGAAITGDAQLTRWITEAVAFGQSQTPK